MKNFLLLVLVLTAIAFAYVSTQVKGSPDSRFNRTTRYSLAKYPLARRVWNLHDYGDARGQYLLGKTPLVLEIVKPANMEVSESLLADTAKKLQVVLNRPVQVMDVDTIKNGELSPADIEDIVLKKRRHVYPKQPNLFVILADKYESGDGEIGSTYKEFGIVLSYSRIQDLSRNYFSSLDQYIQSTLLHEAGHQFGLEHNLENGCIMNEKVNHPDSNGYFSGQYTPTDFCDTELRQLEEIRSLLK